MTVNEAKVWVEAQEMANIEYETDEETRYFKSDFTKQFNIK